MAGIIAGLEAAAALAAESAPLIEGVAAATAEVGAPLTAAGDTAGAAFAEAMGENPLASMGGVAGIGSLFTSATNSQPQSTARTRSGRRFRPNPSNPANVPLPPDIHGDFPPGTTASTRATGKRKRKDPTFIRSKKTKRNSTQFVRTRKKKKSFSNFSRTTKMPRYTRKRGTTRSGRSYKRKNATSTMRTATHASHVSIGHSGNSGYHLVQRMQPTALWDSLRNSALGNGSGAGGFNHRFRLEDMTSFTDFTNIYRFYKILWVKITMYPAQTTHLGTPAGTTVPALDYTAGLYQPGGQAPYVVVAPDNTSDTAFTTEEIALAHSGARFHMFNDPNEFSIYLVPTPKGLVGTAGSESVTELNKSVWISTDNPSEDHFGLRGYAAGFHNGIEVKSILTMKVAFKDLKH